MTANPSVNRYLEDKVMDHIDHALGRPFDPMAETYRNLFAAYGTKADALSQSPHWEEFGREGEMHFFRVTDAGRAALSAHLKTLPNQLRKYEVTFGDVTSFCVAESAGKAKYRRWLDFSECAPDLTFFDFCRAATVRSAA